MIKIKGQGVVDTDGVASNYLGKGLEKMSGRFAENALKIDAVRRNRQLRQTERDFQTFARKEMTKENLTHEDFLNSLNSEEERLKGEFLNGILSPSLKRQADEAFRDTFEKTKILLGGEMVLNDVNTAIQEIKTNGMEDTEEEVIQLRNTVVDNVYSAYYLGMIGENERENLEKAVSGLALTTNFTKDALNIVGAGGKVDISNYEDLKKLLDGANSPKYKISKGGRGDEDLSNFIKPYSGMLKEGQLDLMWGQTGNIRVDREKLLKMRQDVERMKDPELTKAYNKRLELNSKEYNDLVNSDEAMDILMNRGYISDSANYDVNYLNNSMLGFTKQLTGNDDITLEELDMDEVQYAYFSNRKGGVMTNTDKMYSSMVFDQLESMGNKVSFIDSVINGDVNVRGQNIQGTGVKQNLDNNPLMKDALTEDLLKVAGIQEYQYTLLKMAGDKTDIVFLEEMFSLPPESVKVAMADTKAKEKGDKEYKKFAKDLFEIGKARGNLPQAVDLAEQMQGAYQIASHLGYLDDFKKIANKITGKYEIKKSNDEFIPLPDFAPKDTIREIENITKQKIGQGNLFFYEADRLGNLKEVQVKLFEEAKPTFNELDNTFNYTHIFGNKVIYTRNDDGEIVPFRPSMYDRMDRSWINKEINMINMDWRNIGTRGVNPSQKVRREFMTGEVEQPKEEDYNWISF